MLHTASDRKGGDRAAGALVTSRTKRNDQGNICTELLEVWHHLTGPINEQREAVLLRPRGNSGRQTTEEGANACLRQLEAARFICAI